MHAVLVVSLLAACESGDEPAATVTLSGTAYGFGTPDPVAGAIVRIVEAPGREATTGADGAWTLEVPADAEATPYVTHPDFVTMHLQTFDLGRDDLAHVNFQMVTPRVYDLLAQILAVTPDPALCQIASTVSEKVIQAMTYADFRAHGAHGVADATVTLTPAATDVVYFNENVIPDRSLDATSRDGGVVWTNVPAGRYTLRATHATRTFDDVVITCEAGRFVNANPPWGIRER